MTLEQSITEDRQRRSRIVLPGTSEYKAAMKKAMQESKTEKRKPRPNNPASNPTPRRVSTSNFDVDALVNNGRTFYDSTKEGVAIALEQTLNYAGSDGYVATMPEFIAAKIKAPKTHDFWKNWYTVHTEENIGIDREGIFVKRGEPVLVIVNGGGILTPDRIRQAYSEGLVGNSAKYTDKEFNDLLEGRLPDGSSIELHRLDDIKRGVPNLGHRFGVVMPYSLAQNTESGFYKEEAFVRNDLAIARAGGPENLLAYHKSAKDGDGDVGCYHPFNGRDTNVSQGRLLFLINYCYGLSGDSSLDNDGRFVGVGTGGAI